MESFIHELKEAAARGAVCLLCGMETHQSDRYLEGIIADGVNDPLLRRELTRRGGYCPRHLGRFAALAHPLAAAIVLHGLLSSSLERAARGRLGGPIDCPACEVEARTRRSVTASLKRGRADAGVQGALADAPLCALHLELAAQAVPALRTALASRHEGLLHALAELIRKHDYRFAHEWIGDEERAAVVRTLALLGAEARSPDDPR